MTECLEIYGTAAELAVCAFATSSGKVADRMI